MQLLLSLGSRSIVFIEYGRGEVKESLAEIAVDQPMWWVFGGDGGLVSEGVARIGTVMGC